MMHGLYYIYEKIYFISLENREKIISRVQLNFPIYLSMLAVIFYMLRMIDYESELTSLISFFLSLVCCLCFVSISSFFTYRTLCGNYDYVYFTSHSDLIKYADELILFNNNATRYNLMGTRKITTIDVNSDLEKNSFELLGMCCDENNKLNKKRMIFVRNSVFWLWLSAVFFIISSAIFAITDLDVSSPRKDTLIMDQSVAKEINILGQILSSERSCTMPDNGVVKTSLKQAEITDESLPRANSIPKPVMPKPPTYQVISDSYSLWQSKDKD